MQPLPDVNRVVFDLSFVEDGLKELPYDQLQKENYTKLLSVILKRMDKCQLEAVKLTYLRFLDNATGDMLDSIASRFFIPRGDKSDEDLRASIKLFALRQRNQGTRKDIVNILKVLTSNGFVKIYKGVNNYLEVCISVDCIDIREIKSEIETLFPINTNLTLCSVPIVSKPFGVVSIHSNKDVEDLKVGSLGSVHNPITSPKNLVAVTHINDERG
jgi:hypothetical protein